MQKLNRNAMKRVTMLCWMLNAAARSECAEFFCGLPVKCARALVDDRPAAIFERHGCGIAP